MRSIKPTTVRFDEDDMRLVEIVKKKYGQSSLVGALRIALRIAAGDDTWFSSPLSEGLEDREKGKNFGAVAPVVAPVEITKRKPREAAARRRSRKQ